MNMTEVKRLILWLKAKGWSGDEINQILLYLESGEDKYMPQNQEQN